MEKQVLISGASIAGLTLAYWLNRFGYKVTVVEIAKGMRKGGSPIDVRGNALKVAEEMGILEKIKAREYLHTDEFVNAANETLVKFSINNLAEYSGDIEIHRDDLIDILFGNISGVEFLFDNRIEQIVQHADRVDVTFKNGLNRQFEFVFGADGTHSSVRRLVFGGDYSKFFGAYFAFAEMPQFEKPDAGVVLYQEPGKTAALYSIKDTVIAMLIFRSPKLDYDYRDTAQHKQILKENFKNGSWKIPAILDNMLASDNLYFDEVCQIHMPTWSAGRVALVGDAAHTAGFPTGMGTSMAMEGAMILAKELHNKGAFAGYEASFKPFVESVQSRIERGLNWSVPATAAGIKAAQEKFK